MAGTIILPLDGSELAQRAVRYAVPLATRLGANIVLVHASLAMEQSDQSDDALQRVADAIREAGLRAESYRCLTRFAGKEEVARTILSAAREHDAALIVMSTHGRGGLGRLVLGSVADALVRHAETPVLLVPAAYDSPWPHGPALRVLVPLDGSDVAEASLAPVRELAGLTPLELVLLRAVEPPYSFTASMGRLAQVSVDAAPALDSAQWYLDDVAARLGTVATITGVRAEVGHAGAVIAAAAREDRVDVVAMATHGRGGTARAVLGSVTMEVVHRAPAPLLLVRSTIGAEHAHARQHPGAESGSAGPAISILLDDGDRTILDAALRDLIELQPDPSVADAAQRLLDKVDAAAAGAASRVASRDAP